MVIFAVVMMALIFFVGLAIDAGSLYVTYGQLKRAVDAAAVAAANEFKQTENLTSMTAAANEVLALHNVDMSAVNLVVHICDEDGDGTRDPGLLTLVPDFYNRCPDTPTQSARKMIYVEAHQTAPLFFLGMLGFGPVDLFTSSNAEAAAVDLVLVFDISESMSSDTMQALCQPFFDAGQPCPYIDNYDPYDAGGAGYVGCNNDGSCQPLRQAQDAALALIDNLYEGYDQVSIVTFDTAAIVRFGLGQDVALNGLTHLEEAQIAIDAIQLHDDPPFVRIWPQWRRTPVGNRRAYNPVNPEDRDGNGLDADPNLPTCAENATHPLCCNLDEDRWATNRDPYGWGGMPCDDSSVLDAYDWDRDGVYTAADNAAGVAWPTLPFHDPDGDGINSFSPLSTCTGCGIRMATAVLQEFARPSSVWVMIVLSDGIVNMSDTAGGGGGGLGDTVNTGAVIPNAYTNGFCSGSLNNGYWMTACIDNDFANRECIDTMEDSCPDGTTWTGATPDTIYSVLDYALDMTDQAALTRSTNPDEERGNDLAIYTIGLGDVAGTIGEDLLRYMASVGDDGDRLTNPCVLAPDAVSCGQYYYAPTGAALLPIFEDIATRIYTRITQ